MMHKNEDRGLELTFAQAVAVLMRACGVAPVARSAFIARVRQLQRLGLPPRTEPPSDARLAYGLPELAAVATAFRLMSAFLSPTLAARYVLERWTELTPFLLSGAAGSIPADYLVRRPLTGGRFAVIEGAALAELGRKAAHEGRYDGSLGAVSLHGSVDAGDIAAAANGAGVIIDAGTFMPVIIDGLRNTATGAIDGLIHELDRLRFSQEVPAL